MMLRILSVLTLFILASCSSDENKKVLRFAHFWTEPNQQAVLDSLIQVFEENNPTIEIQQVPMQWSEGRMKLLLAFSSSEKPDITHLGLEWAMEFISSHVFLPLTIPDSIIPSQFYNQITGEDGISYCMPWTMNTRALILTHELSYVSDSISWEHILASNIDGPIIGLNSTEKHNVTKRTLPIVWSQGSAILSSLPFSATCDSQLVEGLRLLKKLKNRGLLEQSRILDQYVVQGKIRATISGQWMIPQLRDIPHKVLSRIPGMSGASILSGDCLGISKETDWPMEAKKFVSFLTKYEQAKAFCILLPDAGVPANNDSFQDVTFMNDRDRNAFLQQCKISRTVPSPLYFQDAEEIFEHHIIMFLYGKMSEKDCVLSMKQAFLELEKGQKKGS